MDTNNYQVLARKYRPKKFSELIGQETLISVITNAIKLRTVNISGELIIKEINLLDKDLWVSIVDQFISEEDILNKVVNELIESVS